MPAEKRRRLDASKSSYGQPVVINESDHEDNQRDVERDRPNKKRKTACLSSRLAEGLATHATLFSNSLLPMSSETAVPPETQLQLMQRPPTSRAASAESEGPWGADRVGLRQAIIAVWEKYRKSDDGSIDRTLTGLGRLVTGLESDPGRSPAYKIAQLKKVGNSPLLNLPGEIRNVIWEFANPPWVSCCFAGTKTHDNVRNSDLKFQDELWALIRAFVGRGIPVSRQVLWETRGVATPIDSRFCSRRCASFFVSRIMESQKPSTYTTSWESGKPWRSVQKLEVDMRSEVERGARYLDLRDARSSASKHFDSVLLAKLNRWEMPSDKWTAYVVDDTYVLEKLPTKVVEEAQF